MDNFYSSCNSKKINSQFVLILEYTFPYINIGKEVVKIHFKTLDCLLETVFKNFFF